MWSPADAFRRKLKSLLRPWLREEPHLEVRLGFCRSEVRATDVRFDASALNRLVESSSGGSFLFRSARVGRIAVGFSTWRAPAFAVSVDGVDVELWPRDVSRGRKRDAHFHFRERNRVLDSIDPHVFIFCLFGFGGWRELEMMTPNFECCFAYG